MNDKGFIVVVAGALLAAWLFLSGGSGGITPPPPPPPPGDKKYLYCGCSCGNFHGDPAFGTCNDVCRTKCPGDTQLTNCGTENPVGSGCFPEAVGDSAHCNQNCSLRCSDIDGNYQPCYHECPPHETWNQWTQECTFQPVEGQCVGNPPSSFLKPQCIGGYWFETYYDMMV